MNAYVDEPTDTCPACGETKPLRDFGRNQRRPAGHERDCITCQDIHRTAPDMLTGEVLTVTTED